MSERNHPTVVTEASTHRVRRSPREKAQDALDTANRKIARAQARKAEAMQTLRTIGGEIARLQAERDYLAQHPALQRTVFDRDDDAADDAADTDDIDDGFSVEDPDPNFPEYPADPTDEGASE